LFIDPLTVFTPDISVQIVILVLLGGLGYTAGPLLGAAILIPLGQYLNAALGFSGGGWNMAIFGFAVILIVILRPTGIIGYIFERRRARQDAQLKAEANP
jgi:branched-chain amino acid transport system permease protein